MTIDGALLQDEIIITKKQAEILADKAETNKAIIEDTYYADEFIKCLVMQGYEINVKKIDSKSDISMQITWRDKE